MESGPQDQPLPAVTPPPSAMLQDVWTCEPLAPVWGKATGAVAQGLAGAHRVQERENCAGH